MFVPVGGASREFIYCGFTTTKFKEELCKQVTGTSNSHQRVKPHEVSRMATVVPSQNVLRAFAEFAQPLFRRIGRNRLQEQILAALRDTLLPRLISGQLRLPEFAEPTTEAIT